MTRKTVGEGSNACGKEHLELLDYMVSFAIMKLDFTELIELD